MAKRERNPKPTEERPEEPLDAVFSGIEELGQPDEIMEVLADGEELLPTSDPMDALLGEHIVANPREPTEYGTVDDYLRKKVLMEMYGTENPSEHDKISLALRNYL